jgi:hypothetical protein
MSINSLIVAVRACGGYMRFTGGVIASAKAATMTRNLLSVLLVLLASAGAAQAEIRITVSRFDHNQIEIEGQTAPNRTVTIDGKFKIKTDGGGYFDFKHTGYKPPDCMSDITDGDDIYSAVIAGCFGELKIEHEKLKSPAPPR